MSVLRVVVAATVLSFLAGCGGGFPKCQGVNCDACQDCDHLIGSYSGWMSNFRSDCAAGIDSGLEDQPWGLSVGEILYDESSDSSYLEFDYSATGYGTVRGTLCGPKEKKEEQVHTFCMSFDFDSMLSAETNTQTTTGAFIVGADYEVRFEGTIHNLMHDPINGACHARATILGTKDDIE